jgi:hypothetical protein
MMASLVCIHETERRDVAVGGRPDPRDAGA